MSIICTEFAGGGRRVDFGPLTAEEFRYALDRMFPPAFQIEHHGLAFACGSSEIEDRESDIDVCEQCNDTHDFNPFCGMDDEPEAPAEGQYLPSNAERWLEVVQQADQANGHGICLTLPAETQQVADWIEGAAHAMVTEDLSLLGQRNQMQYILLWSLSWLIEHPAEEKVDA